MSAAGAERHRRGTRIGLVIVAAIILVGGAGLAMLVLSGTPRVYPTSPEGWAARWNAAAAEFGRTPGENWELWLGVEAAIANETDPEFIGAVLDRLAGHDPITHPLPNAIGTANAMDDAFTNLRSIRDTLRGAVVPQISASLRSGDTEAATAWIDRAWSLGRVSDASGSLIGGMVTSGIVAETLDAVRTHALTSPGTPDAGIDAAVRSAPVPEIGWSMRMEREAGVMFIEALRSNSPIIADDQAVVFEDLLIDWVAVETTGDTDARERVATVIDRLETSRLYRLRRPGLDMMVPSVDSAARTLRAVRSERDALLVILALERWSADHGAYPDTLELLVPDYVRALPIDPFADGEALRYRLVDASSSDPLRAYVLYSVGINRTDDGGKEHPGRVGRGLTSTDNAGDHIFNRVPPQTTGIIEEAPDHQPDQTDETPVEPEP